MNKIDDLLETLYYAEYYDDIDKFKEYAKYNLYKVIFECLPNEMADAAEWDEAIYYLGYDTAIQQTKIVLDTLFKEEENV